MQAQKSVALAAGSNLGVIAPASPAHPEKVAAGLKELKRLGYQVSYAPEQHSAADGYFSAPADKRLAEFLELAAADNVKAIIASRGGYGSNYLLDGLSKASLPVPKCVIGFSDLTTLQIYLWQSYKWVSIHGPMVAAGLEGGADVPGGYDEASFLNAIRRTEGGWRIPLHGETIRSGHAEGILLGGCMTLIEATIGTAWELDTRGAILVLEDRAMKPYQVDRVLMHFKQTGKFNGVAGILLGEFPECEAPVKGSPTVRDVCNRILSPLGIPIIFGAPVGHTPRPMLTLPLGVKARVDATGEGLLEILEPAVSE
jgi:muramoyltetrapeptide carboxypeptidase